MVRFNEIMGEVKKDREKQKRVDLEEEYRECKEDEKMKRKGKKRVVVEKPAEDIIEIDWTSL